MTKRLVGHYQLDDPRLTGKEQQELENQLAEAAVELDIPLELVKEYYRLSFQEYSFSDTPSDTPLENEADDGFVLGVHLPSWQTGYRKCLEVIQHMK